MKPLFAYIWEHSRREQLLILLVVLLSFPFYFYSLDLPKYIVSDAIQGRAFAAGKTEAVLFHLALTLPGFLGGAHVELFSGISLSRLPYLFALSALFLLLVVINGVFKYIINMRKGALGERLLQYLRFDLFSLLLRFSPEALRNVKASEAATIIKDEVEPIGGFVGDAFIQPVFLGGQALTALTFILLQSPILGFLAGLIVFVQAAVIPRLRREQIRLGKERQLRSRALAGRIGEVVDGISEVGNHGTSAFERQRIGGMLEQLFTIRYRLYGRKFAVKFANNLLAQMTPFLFYTLGGVAALRGEIDIGQLVAVIAAYRELPPPVKELIDWDQQRLDVDVKYQQVVEQFSAGVAPSIASPSTADMPDLINGSIVIQGLKVMSASDDVLVDGINLTLPLGKHIALAERAGDGARTLAQILARRLSLYTGSVRINGVDLSSLPISLHGRHVAHAIPDAAIFDASIRDNLIYSLQQRVNEPDMHGFAAAADCVDYSLAGVADAAGLDHAIGEVLRDVGLDEAVFRFGLARKLESGGDGLVEHMVELRGDVRRQLDESGLAALVEPFDADAYNDNSTIGENLLFGVPLGEAMRDTNLAMLPFTRQLLDQCGLSEALALTGRRIAVTMVEIFTGVSSDHFLFEQFSFISADELDDFRDMLGRTDGPVATFSSADRDRLVALAFLYVEPRHRLGLLDAALRDKVLLARHQFRRSAPSDLATSIEFYDSERYCTAAPLRDNLLFGRITYGASGAAEKVTTAIRQLLIKRGFDVAVFRLGLEQPCGHAGRLLFPAQRSAIALARCLMKRPDILIINEGVLNASEPDGAALLERLRRRMAGKSLFVVLRASDPATGFDARIELAAGKVVSGLAAAERDTPEPAARAASDSAELGALQAVPMFADVDLARLKLLAFTSERLSYRAGDVVFRQGDPSDSAYVLISGRAEIIINTADGPMTVNTVSRGAIVGEIGIITGAPRSATIRALEDISVLCLRQDIFLSLMSEFPEMSLAVTRLVVRRLQDNIATLQSQRR